MIVKDGRDEGGGGGGLIWKGGVKGVVGFGRIGVRDGGGGGGNWLGGL